MYEKSKYVEDVTRSVGRYLGQNKLGLALAGLAGVALVGAAAGNLDSAQHAVPVMAYDSTTMHWFQTSKDILCPDSIWNAYFNNNAEGMRSGFYQIYFSLSDKFSLGLDGFCIWAKEYIR